MEIQQSNVGDVIDFQIPVNRNNNHSEEKFDKYYQVDI